MISTKELYLYVKELISAIPEVSHFDYWNENIVNEGDVTPYPVPAVFFELFPTVWDQSTFGSTKNQSDKVPQQSGNAEFILHIVIKKIDSADVDTSELLHYDVITKVFEAVHFAPTKPFIEGRIQRLRDETVVTHNVLRDYPLAFGVRLFECPTTDIGDGKTLVSPWEPDIDYEPTIPPHLNPDNPITFTI